MNSLSSAAILLSGLLLSSVVPATAQATIGFRAAGGTTSLQLVVDDDGEQVNGAPANHFWTVQQTDGTAQNFTISAPVDAAFNGGLPTIDTTIGTCTPTNAREVVCSAPTPVASVNVYTGDGNDQVDLRRSSVMALLHGELGSDYLIGGDGNDVISGGDGDDYLRGACGADNYNGGAGVDAVTYAEDSPYSCTAHAAGITVSLDDVANDVDGENAGGPASAIEGIHGTDGPDTLTLGKASGLVYGNGGNDTIHTRNDLADVPIECGAGADTLTSDLRTRDTSINADCETVDAAAIVAPTPTQPGPTIKPPLLFTGGDACPTGQNTKEVAGVKVCYRTEKKLSADRYELAGDVNLVGFLFFSTSQPITVDTKAKTFSYAGNSTIQVKYGSTRYDVMRTEGAVSMGLGQGFSINATTAYPLLEVAKVRLGMFVKSNGLVNFAATQGAKINVSVANKSITYDAGGEFLGKALTTTGTAGYSAVDGPLINMRGCLNGSLPVGNSTRIAEIRNACVTYNSAARAWSFSGQAVLAGAFESAASADLVGGSLNSFNMSFAGKPRIPMPFASYLDGGGIGATNLQTNPFITGNVHGGWPYASGGTADLVITGRLTYDWNGRKLGISGTGTLKVAGVQVADGGMNLTLGLGGSFEPRSLDSRVYANALGGFVNGSIDANIDGAGFYAAGLLSVGFPAGAEVTNNVNGTIEWWLHCNMPAIWVVPAINWCPYVTNKYATGEAAISSKGVGAKADFANLFVTAWWVGATKQFNTNFGFGSSASLSAVIGRSRGRGVPDGEVMAATTTMKWEIPKDARMASLQLEGSAQGDLKLTDPTGRVVFDSTAGTYVEGIGASRDGAGRAAIGVFKPALKPGTWTVSTAGPAPFTKVTALVSHPPEVAKVTAATPIGPGVKPSARALVAGRSRLKLTYTVPKGATMSLRASTPDGRHSLPIVGGVRGSGAKVWKVSAEWAGKLRITAVTERDGVPTDRTTFPTTFVVTRPALTAPAGVKVKRGAKGTLIVSWKRVAGADSYDVELLVGRAAHGAHVVAHGTNLVLTPRSAAALRVKVRAVGTTGRPGAWSVPVGVKAIPVRKPARPARA